MVEDRLGKTDVLYMCWHAVMIEFASLQWYSLDAVNVDTKNNVENIYIYRHIDDKNNTFQMVYQSDGEYILQITLNF